MPPSPLLNAKPLNVPQALAQALELHRQGRLAEAEPLYSAILAVRPDGTVRGWGNNSGGALDAPPHVRFKAVGAGFGYSVGISCDGILWGWGTPVSSPIPPPAYRNPPPSQSWSFESAGWTRHGDSAYWYIPDERFKSVGASAFHISAIAADDDDGEED